MDGLGPYSRQSLQVGGDVRHALACVLVHAVLEVEGEDRRDGGMYSLARFDLDRKDGREGLSPSLDAGGDGESRRAAASVRGGDLDGAHGGPEGAFPLLVRDHDLKSAGPGVAFKEGPDEVGPGGGCNGGPGSW
jgi:hypothetical protein